MGRTRTAIPKNGEVIELLNQRVLVSHAVTLMPEEYIKNAVCEFLTSHMLQLLNIVKVNDDPKNLEASMLACSFAHPDDLALLLHGCVSSTSGIKITQEAEKSLSVEEKNRREVEQQLGNCSLEEIIDHVKNSMGMPRIRYFEKHDAIQMPMPVVQPVPATPAPVQKSDKIGSFIRVEKPAEINYSKLDFTHFTTDAALDVFLKDIIKYESGLSDKLDVSVELFDPLIGKVFDKMLEWQELACKEAKNSSYNNISFDVVKDPWANLFAGL